MLLLGLKNYVAQGGDIGSAVARICVTHYEECIGSHVNMIFSQGPPPDADMSILTDHEKMQLGRMKDFLEIGSSYARSHATVPATVGLVLTASPVALLAWVGEKLVRWTDKTPPIQTILDFISLYYLTDTIPRNIYSYREIFNPANPRPAAPPIPDGKPFGWSAFEKEISLPPKAWVEEQLGGKEKLTYYKYHEKGGHFAALEKPEELLADVDEFVELVKSKGH